MAVRLILFFLLIASGQMAWGQTRHALVIGIDAYSEIRPLDKAVNDATAVASVLAESGYSITLADTPETTTQTALIATIARFASTIEPGDVALVFFAGHGVEIQGSNLLLPSDLPNVDPSQEGAERLLETRSLSVDQLTEDLRQRSPQAVVLILDACRDNPLPRSPTRTLGTDRGLGGTNVPTDVFVLYSAGIGQAALDNLDRPGFVDPDPNSVFTRSLLPLLAKPGLHPADIARQLRGAVADLAATVNHQQRPAYYDELPGDFALVVAEASARLDPAVTGSEIDQTGAGGAGTVPPTETGSVVIGGLRLAPPGLGETVNQEQLVRSLQAALNVHNCRAGPEDGSHGLRSARAALLFNLVAPSECGRLSELEPIGRDEPTSEWRASALSNLRLLEACNPSPACGTPPGPDYHRDFESGCWYHATGTDPYGYGTWSGTCDANDYASGPGTLTFHYPVEVRDTFYVTQTGSLTQGRWVDGEVVMIQRNGSEARINYRNGVLHGPYAYKHGVAGFQEHGVYEDGERHGAWVRTGPNNYRREVIYDSGQTTWATIRFESNTNGSYHRYEGHINADLELHGKGIYSVYGADQSIFQIEIGNWLNNRRDGIFSFAHYRADGTISFRNCIEYRDGVQLRIFDVNEQGTC